MASLVLTRGPTRTREARRRAATAPARAAAALPRRPRRFESHRPRNARPWSCATRRVRAAAAEAAGMGKGAAGLQQEDFHWRSGGTGRRTRRARMRRMPGQARARMAWAASPACADTWCAGAGPGPDGLGGKTGVRGCVACRRWPGPNKSRKEHHHRASPITSRTTAGRAKDRRGGGDVQCTSMPFTGFKPSNGV